MKPFGFSLVELCVALVLISVSLMLAVPELSSFYQKQQIRSELGYLIRAITTARDQAITFNQSVYICPSQNQIACGGDWHDGFISYVDLNFNSELDGEDTVLLTKGNYREGDKIFWRAFRRRNFLEFSPLGFTAFQNGTFTYCPREGLEYAEGLILNIQGRLRFTSDSDGDGIDEGANGRPLRCE